MAADPARKIENEVDSGTHDRPPAAASPTTKQTRAARRERTPMPVTPEIPASPMPAEPAVTATAPTAPQERLPTTTVTTTALTVTTTPGTSELWPLATLPHRAALALLDAQLSLLETGFALAFHHLHELETGADEAVAFCRRVNEAAPAAQLELQLEQAGRALERAGAAAQHRFELAAREQALAVQSLAHRTAALVAELRPRQG